MLQIEDEARLDHLAHEFRAAFQRRLADLQVREEFSDCLVVETIPALHPETANIVVWLDGTGHRGIGDTFTATLRLYLDEAVTAGEWARWRLSMPWSSLRTSLRTRLCFASTTRAVASVLPQPFRSTLRTRRLARKRLTICGLGQSCQVGEWVRGLTAAAAGERRRRIRLINSERRSRLKPVDR